jgi:hypothetical protein
MTGIPEYLRTHSKCKLFSFSNEKTQIGGLDLKPGLSYLLLTRNVHHWKRQQRLKQKDRNLFSMQMQPKSKQE